MEFFFELFPSERIYIKFYKNLKEKKFYDLRASLKTKGIVAAFLNPKLVMIFFFKTECDFE